MFFIDKIILKANAKINLTLDIFGKRSDGYHEIETIMQSVSLCDTVTITKSKGIELECSIKKLCGHDNLAYKAAELFFKAAKIENGVNINIEKRIPLAAGLAGGSADAAAVLVGLDTLFKTNLGKEKLCELGLVLGADVPFCIIGGTMLAQGIGEKLSPVEPMPECSIVIAKNGEKPSTGALYSQYDRCKPKKRPDTEKMLTALKLGSVTDVSSSLCNVFEEVAPACINLKQKMIDLGAAGASLSGSGPSVFGIFSNENDALKCAAHLGIEAFVCKPVRNGCEIIFK